MEHKKRISCFQMMVDVRIPSGLSKYSQVFTKIISLVSSFVHHFNSISLCYSLYCIYRFGSMITFIIIMLFCLKCIRAVGIKVNDLDIPVLVNNTGTCSVTTETSYQCIDITL